MSDWWVVIEEDDKGMVAHTPEGDYTSMSHNSIAFRIYVLNALACRIPPHEVKIGA